VSRIHRWATRSKLRSGLLAALAVFLLIQLVPYGRDHSNPAPTRAIAFDSPRTEQLATGACGDCHSDLTNWPIESSIAPASWLIQRDVEGGRSRLNFSEWDHPQPALSEVVGQIKGGGMPPLQYKLLHPDARLSDSEKADLVAGLTRTYAEDPPGGP
jgi:hypothetical protein